MSFGSSGGSGFGGHEPDQGVALNLTALMDILSNLLFFLLASYSAQSMEVEAKSDLKLPASSSQAKLMPSVTLSVTRHDILVAGVPVAEIADNKLVGAIVDGEKIIPLFDRLKNVRASRTAAGQTAGQDGLPGDEMVMLLADKGTDADIITKVLKTSGMAGYVNVRFGVLSQ